MKVVLSGSPCAGKTTLIRKLQKLGFPVVQEQATIVMNAGTADPCIDHEAFQFEVLRRQRAEEARYSNVPLLFLDRGAHDGIPYRWIYGRRVPEFFAALQPKTYDVCFLLETLPWVDDGVRYESADFSAEIEPCFGRVYESYGVPVIRVPVMSPEQRLQFILDRVGGALGACLATASTAKPVDRVSVIQDESEKRRWYSVPSLAGIMSSGLSPSPAIPC